MQSGVSTRTGMSSDPILVRKPAFPRWWNPIARPHVAVLVRDSISGDDIRYYLSEKGTKSENGRIVLDVSSIEGLSEGTLLEVRFNATKANLYRLEMVDGVSCWRWVGRCRELLDFEQPSEIKWNGLLEESGYSVNEIMTCKPTAS
ncbi:MAG: hypothetical protein ACFE7R_00135 [Candidatus Hodarchaeota archaeon]